MSYYGTDNDYMMDMMALYPKVFVGTAVIDPHSEGAANLMGGTGQENAFVPFASILD